MRVPTGLYSDEEIEKFNDSGATEQMEFLKSEYESVTDEEVDDGIRGAKADEMRDLRDSGGLVTNQEFGGTFNTAVGPYNGIGYLLNAPHHVIQDVKTWQKWGGGRFDFSTVQERKARTAAGFKNPYGSTDRNLMPKQNETRE